MQLKNVLTPERCVTGISVSSKKRVLENLAKLFAETIDELEEVEVFQHLINRERLGSTGIGEGIGIPHCRFPTNGETFGACITLSEPVDFDSADNKPVDVIFAMLVPENAENSHLQALAALAEAFQKPEFVKKLRKTNSGDQLFDALVEELP